MNVLLELVKEVRSTAESLRDSSTDQRNGSMSPSDAQEVMRLFTLVRLAEHALETLGINKEAE